MGNHRLILLCYPDAFISNAENSIPMPDRWGIWIYFYILFNLYFRHLTILNIINGIGTWIRDSYFVTKRNWIHLFIHLFGFNLKKIQKHKDQL